MVSNEKMGSSEPFRTVTDWNGLKLNQFKCNRKKCSNIFCRANFMALIGNTFDDCEVKFKPPAFQVNFFIPCLKLCPRLPITSPHKNLTNKFCVIRNYKKIVISMLKNPFKIIGHFWSIVGAIITYQDIKLIVLVQLKKHRQIQHF